MTKKDIERVYPKYMYIYYSDLSVCLIVLCYTDLFCLLSVVCLSKDEFPINCVTSMIHIIILQMVKKDRICLNFIFRHCRRSLGSASRHRTAADRILRV